MIIDSIEKIEVNNLFDAKEIKIETNKINTLSEKDKKSLTQVMKSMDQLINGKTSSLLNNVNKFLNNCPQNESVNLKINIKEILLNNDVLHINYYIKFEKNNNSKITSIESLDYKFNDNGFRNLIYICNEDNDDIKNKNYFGYGYLGLKEILKQSYLCEYGVPQKVIETIQDLTKKLSNDNSR